MLLLTPRSQMPTRATFIDQIITAQTAIFSYAILPLFAAFLAERGLSRTYYYVSEVGWPTYIACTLLYLVLVEICIYWIHRWLHEVKFLYKNVHRMHHLYKSAEEVSSPPIASHRCAVASLCPLYCLLAAWRRLQ